MAIPEIDEDLLFYVNMSTENDEFAVKTLRKAVFNTMLMSESYPGSKLQEQFGHIIEGREKSGGSSQSSEPTKAAPKSEAVPKGKPAPQNSSDDDLIDDDAPF